MSTLQKLGQDIELARRELKNIRQECRKQKADLKAEVLKIKSFLSHVTKVKSDPTKNSKEMCKEYPMNPIGFVSSCFKNKNGIPRQPSLCPAAKATIKIEKKIFTNPEHSLIGLEDFSHIWVIFVFHENGKQSSIKAKVHPPRLNGTTVGVFSTRSPHRPSPIGLSLVKLDQIEGDTLFLSGIDLLHGTPVLDIKPYIPMYDIPSDLKENQHPLKGDSQEKAIEDKAVSPTAFPKISQPILQTACTVASFLKKPMQYLSIIFTVRAMADLENFHPQSSHKTKCQNCLNYEYDPLEVKHSISDVLKNDPRSVYRRQKCKDRLYYFCINSFHVTSWFDDNIVEVLRIKLENAAMDVQNT